MSSNVPEPASGRRRELSRQARDAFPPMGIYAIRTTGGSRLRIGSSRDVQATFNRIRFELRLRSHPDKALQAEWDRCGADHFVFEVLELVQERRDPGFDYAAELAALEELYRAEAAQGGAA